MRDRFRFSCARRPAAEQAKTNLLAITLALSVLAVGCSTATPQTTGHATGVPRAAAPSPTATGRLRSPAALPTGATRAPQTATPSHPLPPPNVSAAQLARLPAATTYATTPTAPQDPAPFEPETGTVLHPTAAQVIYTRPGGPAEATLPATELGSPTWVPVVQSQPGWDQILLPTRPNRSTGWIHLGSGGLRIAYTAYRVEISLSTYRLTILNAGHSLGTWTVADGAADTPTPAGRTFLLASLAPPHPTYSPLILPLGAHSNTLTTYGGGPGTVGLHGWPDPAVFGHAASHGCVRVPAAALRELSRIPLGTPVMITS
jgi:lipoprotein-anchoring transpeptidase ErfK/SrfK